MPNIENQINLGIHDSCHGAVAQKRNGRIIELMAAIIAVTPVTLANFMFYNYFIKLQ